MGEYSRCRIILSLMMGLIMLVMFPSDYTLADSSESSDGDENGISISTIVPPSIISKDSIYEKGGSSGITFTTDDVKENLIKVLVDGKEIASQYYTVSGDPLTITLNVNFLNTLASENHTVEIVTVNGTASANFTVMDENQQKTQENSSEQTSEQAKKPSEKQSKKRTEEQQAQNDSRYSVSTGDKADIVLWMIVMVSSLIGMIVVIMRIKKISAECIDNFLK
ncbi:MAG: hypothetical protein IJ065_02220 [Eubacterium sp.]|nr:hypothetical protein [Eubacterium sp.]